MLIIKTMTDTFFIHLNVFIDTRDHTRIMLCSNTFVSFSYKSWSEPRCSPFNVHSLYKHLSD